jgi:hypothetical protein
MVSSSVETEKIVVGVATVVIDVTVSKIKLITGTPGAVSVEVDSIVVGNVEVIVATAAVVVLK